MSVLPGNILDMYLNFAECQADIASHIVAAAPHQKIQPHQKPDHSLVTELDSKIEITIRNNIKSQFPKHGIIGEEVSEHQPYAEYQWVIDPVDGTQEFVNGSPLFGFIICLQYMATPIIGIIDHPLLDLRCKAILGQGAVANDVAVRMHHTPKSRQGIVMPARADFTKHDDEEHLFEKISSEFPNYRVFRSCYGHTSTLLGHTCMTIEHDVQIWDIVATRILIEEAGGIFHVLRKKKLITGEDVYSVLFGEPEIIEQAIELLATYYQD